MEQQSLPAEALPQTATSVSSFRGLIEVFYQPSVWFDKLRNDPKVLIPYLLLLVVYLVYAYALKDILNEYILSTPDVQEQLLSGQIPQAAKPWLWLGGAATILVSPMLAPLAAAALALFWGNVVFAGKARFKQLLSVMLYGEVILAFGNLLILPLALAKESLVVGLNLGVLVAERGLEDPLYAALSKLDLFVIWEIVVIGIGLAIIYGFPRNKGYKLSVLSMGLLTILGVAGAAIGSMF